MISIGNRTQIAQFNILVPSDEYAWVEIPIDEWLMKLKITFSNVTGENNHGFSLTSQDDHAILNLNNWNSNLPMGIEIPFQVAVMNDRPIEIIFSGYAVGKLKKVEFIVLWGNPNGK